MKIEVNKNFVILAVIGILFGITVYAVAPNPGHSWSSIGDIPADIADGDNQNLVSVLSNGNNAEGNSLTNVGSISTTGISATGDITTTADMYASGYYYSSDERLKENITEINNAVSLVKSLDGVSFNWKENDEKSMGLIAQDVEKIFPEIVSVNAEGYKSVQYGVLVAVLIEAVKEQQKEIDELKEQIGQ
jgi:hypothetical protein